MDAMQEDKGDQHLIVQFEIKAVHMEAQSKKEGRPIFEDREFIHIFFPGDRNSEIYREVNDRDKVRFARQYERFRQQASNLHVGTPLSQWPFITPARQKLLEHHNIFTVEHMAEASDIAIQKLGMGAREWREQAQVYLKQHAKDDEKARMQQQIDELKSMVASLAAPKAAPVDEPEFEGAGAPTASQVLSQLEGTAERRGPGRPPKVRD